MSKTIFLPDEKTAARMIENAWKDFRNQVKEHTGAVIPDDSPFKDIFVAGYAYGWSDCLNLIRDQITMNNFTDGFGNDEGGGDKG